MQKLSLIRPPKHIIERDVFKKAMIDLGPKKTGETEAVKIINLQNLLVMKQATIASLRDTIKELEMDILGYKDSISAYNLDLKTLQDKVDKLEVGSNE